MDPRNFHQSEIYYRDVCDWWRTTGEEIQMEQPDEVFGFQVAILRRKLRVIWLLANAGNVKAAMARTHQTAVWACRLQRGPFDAMDEAWRDRRVTATRELMKIVPRLMICENASCESRYFIRDTQRKYCSPSCSVTAQESRKLERMSLGQPTGNLTEEGKAKISLIQKMRWEEFRKAKRIERWEGTCAARERYRKMNSPEPRKGDKL
jgi:hypothetical protein